VFQTIISGKEVWNSVGLLGEANVLALVSRQVPGVKDVYFTHGGCGFYHAVVAIAQKRAGWSKQAILATFAAFPPLKMVTVVDDDVATSVPTGVHCMNNDACVVLAGIAALDVNVKRCATAVRATALAIGVVSPVYEPLERFAGVPLPTKS
jgi:hypothetical protein